MPHSNLHPQALPHQIRKAILRVARPPLGGFPAVGASAMIAGCHDLAVLQHTTGSEPSSRRKKQIMKSPALLRAVR